MKQTKSILTHLCITCTAAALLLFTVFYTLPSIATAAPPTTSTAYPLGYGFNVAEWDTAKVQELGFNWIKVFNAPGSEQPVNILLRVDVSSNTLNDLEGFRSSIRTLAQNNGAYIDAYEIGNEVNLDASYGWTTAPIAADYVTVLCAAYNELKTHDPTALVVSAGLAPTGRVSGSWEGHAGHNGLYQDEREYFKEMLTANAADCLDVVGYHNYGYSADYDTAPDTNGGTPETNCTNGFCFRGVEKIYEIMATNGLTGTKIWTTEYGWITDPAEEGLGSCKDNDPGWQGRAWQIVSQEKQAENLAGSFQYAAENWPWMGAMFVFNLNFNQASYYDDCEQMRFYSVQGRPAEAALRDMPKFLEQPTPLLELSGPTSLSTIAVSHTLPLTLSGRYTLTNSGTAPLTYTISASDTAAFTPTLSISPTATLTPGQTTTFTIQATWAVTTPGTYTSTVTIQVTPTQSDFPHHIPLHITIVDRLIPIFLPLTTHP